MQDDNHSDVLARSLPSALDSVILDAVERVQRMGQCPRWSLSVVVDSALWESLIYRLSMDLGVVAELTSRFHLDTTSRVSVIATLNALRRSEAIISPAVELSLAMSIASFLPHGSDWVKAELRERGSHAVVSTE